VSETQGWHGRPGWRLAWQPAIGSPCGKTKPRKLRRLGPDQYRIVSALPGGAFVLIPIGRFDIPALPPR
jgi:hypothetical protein